MAKSALRISVQHLDHWPLVWYLADAMIGPVAWIFLVGWKFSLSRGPRIP